MIKWLPLVVTAVVYLFGFVAQPVQEFVKAHPDVATALGGLLTIIGIALRSPVAGPAKLPAKEDPPKPEAKPASFEL